MSVVQNTCHIFYIYLYKKLTWTLGGITKRNLSPNIGQIKVNDQRGVDKVKKKKFTLHP